MNEYYIKQFLFLQVLKELLKTQYDILFRVDVEINYRQSIFKWLYCDYFKITLSRKQEGLEEKKGWEGNHDCVWTCGIISSSMLFFPLFYITRQETSLGKDIANDIYIFPLKEKKEVSL